MPKLLAHLVTAAAIVILCRVLGAPRWVMFTGVVAGALLVHLIWERLFQDPFLYLGARLITPDDPVMLDAKQKAKESMPRLHALFPAHRKDTVVRFALHPPNGDLEHVWGDLLELSDTRAKVFLRTPPKQAMQLDSRTMEISVDTIDDWQIELQDGSLLGGYTNQALFRIYEREEGRLHPAFHEQIARFRDRLDGAPFAGVTWKARSKPARE